MSKNSNLNGRPSPYDKNIHPDWGWSLAMKGLIDKQIAKEMGISRSTLSKWKNEHEEFREALATGKNIADSKVERSLFQRACGYSYTERRIISVVDPRTGKPNIDRIETMEKVVPPDTTAIIYWLKNRRRDEWKDKWDVDVNNNNDIVFKVVEASKEVTHDRGKNT